MKMRLCLWCISFVFLCCCGIQNGFAYKIPPVQLELKEEGFLVSIPHDDGITMAIYNIEINEQCPLLLDLLTKPMNNRWTTKQVARKLQNNAKVKINLLIMHKEGIYSRTDSVRLLDNNIIHETIKEADKPIDPCTAAKPQLNADGVIKNSETKVFINQKPSRRIFKPNDLIFEELFKSPKLSNWNRGNYLHSNAIGDRSEDFTAVRDDNSCMTVSRETLLITPIISQAKNKATIELKNCKQPVCYENNTFTCAYVQHKNRSYAYPPPVNTSRIDTNGKFSFTYGRIEIYATLPYGDWLFPYMMLVPDNLSCTTRKQLRIAFATSVDIENNRIRGGPVILNGLPNKGKLYFVRTSHMAAGMDFNANGYHNFTLVWTSTEIHMYADNKKYGCYINNGEYAEPYHIVLGVGAGGHLEFEDTRAKPWKNTLDNAFALFHRSFTGCCENATVKKECRDSKRKRTCSREWGSQAAMAVKYVRVYAV
ncbi:gram-negative bacteria-binding protein 2 isoform X2 [Bactrocera neohumeralis]|uniref:gram-negative bacteria-binding protein 2 isoform X2 n=1 Tax=Bactrocera neohumeralis TaxID=98809 RepID=UPI002165A207|nr:gram-negative bacteria-binding protein 2 isoform X2 [Bactrocera neohumeralis]